MYHSYIFIISITMISSIMQNFLYNNKVQKFPLAFRKRNVWKFGTPFGTLARQNVKLARHSARRVEKLARFWHVSTYIGTLARKKREVGTRLARGHVDHAGTHGTYGT